MRNLYLTKMAMQNNDLKKDGLTKWSANWGESTERSCPHNTHQDKFWVDQIIK